MIRVDELTKTFGSKKQEKKVLDRTTWTVDNGRIAGLFGNRGSGRTITLRIITGIQKPTSGKIFLDKINVMENPEEAKYAFGFVPDSTEQFFGMKGTDFLSFLADVYEVPEKERQDFLEKYLDELDMKVHLGDRMETLSKTRYKKVRLLGAMIHSPKNLILDNIFDGLDDSDVSAVKKVLKAYAAQGNSVLFTANKLKISDNLCDQILYLDGGRLTYNGSVKGMKDKYGDHIDWELMELHVSGKMQKLSGDK